MLSAKLTLVPSPLGNLGDLTPRAKQALEESTVWWVEDTRVSRKLQHLLEIHRPMKVLNDHTSDTKMREMLNQAIDEKHQIAIITDAGVPGISDPGARCVDLAYDLGVEVDGVPGGSAVTHALMLSGFFAQRFAFLGFLGRKPSAIRKDLEPFLDSSLTIVLFESPYRVLKLMQEVSQIMGDRRYVICREMTKFHQQVYRSRFPAVPTSKDVPEKGEFTIVIEGKRSEKFWSETLAEEESY